ncbi:MAG: BTAD domain-containing putative transcriptional regulator [Chloroflexota bacterium]
MAGIVPAKVRAPRVRWLARERLDQLVPRLWQHRLTLVVAPAGSGKTTLPAARAGHAGAPAAWYRAESVDGSERSLAAHLAAAFAAVVPNLEPAWQTMEEAAAALDARPEARLLLVIDDLHALTGTPAEAALERFLDYAPPALAVVAGTRVAPSFNLSRRRVAGEIMELSGDDLRFRPWEVERLFRDFYDDALRPDELARLARRTEGWAAGLQLFHLATRGKAAAERQRLLVGLGPSSRLMREYLARNVVAELPDELREFLVGTCVLRRLTGGLCDRLLERHGSRALLEELERRSVFTVAVDDEGTYRYHEVLRSHLEGMLVETVGESAARARARRGGELLEGDGAIAEAVAAYARGEDWAAVDRLLDRHGERLAAGQGAWMDTLPPSLLVQDPWLTLATARRQRAEGRWAQAVDAYGRAEALFGSGEAGAACHRERLALAAWLDPRPAPTADWSGALRSAIAHDPLIRRPTGEDEASRLVAAGLGALIGGRVADARRMLRRAADEESCGPVIGSSAVLGAAVAGLLAGDPRAVVETEQAVAAVERAGLGWLARVGRAALSMAGAPAGAEYARSDATAVRNAAAREEDRWGEGLAALAEGWAAMHEPEAAVEPLETAAARFRALGAGSLEAWARGLAALALARAGAPDAREAALGAEAVARSTGIVVVAAVAQRALAELDPVADGELGTAADGILAEAGVALPAGGRSVSLRPDPGAGPAATGQVAARPVEIRLFGSFAMTIEGRPVDLGRLKPRPRAVLRFLALNAGGPVHREVLQETFWPEADPETGAKNLHVALSALRRELAPRAGRGACDLLVRDGEAYRLALPDGARIDLAEFERAVTEARTIRARGATRVAIEALRVAFAAYGGDLLPEDGPAEWAAGRRERARAEAVEAARALAELLLDGDPTGAAEACAGGLALDPHHDPLWRILVEARERAGDQAAATSARSGYARMLAELGVTAGEDA